MPQLVAIDLAGGDGFLGALRRAWDRGDAVLPLDQRLSAAAKSAVVKALRPSLIADGSGETRLPGGEPVAEGDALVMATSGTTGTPKGVVLTHQAVEASARATSARLGVDPSAHRWIACLPLSHIGGMSVVTRSLLTGTRLTLLPRFDASGVQAAGGPDALVSLVPTALRRLDAGLFRTVVLGGSAPPEALAPNVVTTYGLSETGSGVVYDGVPLEGVEVAIDPETSEISLRCPMLLRCYRDGRVPLDPGGWFRTGDAGHLDSAGRLQVVGRLSDMIITGGENVWPAPIEAALRRHPGVAEVAVAGRPDPEWGEKVVAWVVPADPNVPPALEELKELVAEQLAPYAVPKDMLLVEGLPKTSIGKIRRDLLPWAKR